MTPPNWKHSCLALFFKLFTRSCPNCESAWTGGHSNPQNLTFCVVCSDPKTGKIRGWCWRTQWLQLLLVSRHNFRKHLLLVNRHNFRKAGQ